MMTGALLASLAGFGIWLTLEKITRFRLELLFKETRGDWNSMSLESQSYWSKNIAKILKNADGRGNQETLDLFLEHCRELWRDNSHVGIEDMRAYIKHICPLRRP